MMQLQSLPPMPPPNPPPQPPLQSSKRMMIQQQEEPPSLQEQPPPQFVADKSLIGLPPKFHLHCYPMQGSLGGLHKRYENILFAYKRRIYYNINGLESVAKGIYDDETVTMVGAYGASNGTPVCLRRRGGHEGCTSDGQACGGCYGNPSGF